MQNFDDVLSQLVALLRRSDAGGFVPRAAGKSRLEPRPITLRRPSGSKPTMAKPAVAKPTVPTATVPTATVPKPTVPTATESRHHGTALVSYRDVYHCPASTWGRGGYVPEARAPRSPETPECPDSRPATAGAPKQSVKMPFRIFDEP